MAGAVIGRRSLLGAAALLGVTGWARAEAWPSRPIKLVAPFAPGGGSDFTSRLIAEKMGTRLGQTIIVENKPGAGGNLGAEAAIKGSSRRLHLSHHLGQLHDQLDPAQAVLRFADRHRGDRPVHR